MHSSTYIPPLKEKTLEVVITIFKDQLEATPQLASQLASLSLEVKDISAAFLYIPREDSLIEFVSLLHEFMISFGAHAPSEDILKRIRWNEPGKSSI